MVFTHVKTTLTRLLSPSPNKGRTLTDHCALVEMPCIKSSRLPLPELQSSGSLWPLPPVVFCLSLQAAQLGTPEVNGAAGPPRSSHQRNRIQTLCALASYSWLSRLPNMPWRATRLSRFPSLVMLHTVETVQLSIPYSGFFAVKLCKHQVTWLPCEIKALAIATANKHIIKHVHVIQSSHLMVVLTVSSPCVHANEKLKREEFSTSSLAL